MSFFIDLACVTVQIICDYSPRVGQTFGTSTRNGTELSIAVANSHYQLPVSGF